jgi:glycosyltransferase involved in cell wall biosynthesis
MAAGCPVVAARVAALPDAVIHGETGLLVDQGGADEVAAALERLLANPESRLAMGEAGRRRAAALFAPEHHAAAMEALYLEALARRDRHS